MGGLPREDASGEELFEGHATKPDCTWAAEGVQVANTQFGTPLKCARGER